MMHLNRKKTPFFLILCGLFLLMISGCGRKRPPLPPIIKDKRIASPENLKYKMQDSDIILTWQHKVDPVNAKANPDRFEIFMAKKRFDACEGCPFQFKSIGWVPMPETKFSIPLEKGFKYYFRVQALNEDNMKSQFSRTVQFDCE